MTIVICGGFYGTMLALKLSEQGEPVTLLEKEEQLLTRASAINQARVHQGYHYPRAILTARRSRVNYAAFVADFKEAVVDHADTHYAIARDGSKVTARQFRLFCERIGAPLSPVPKNTRALFQPDMIEDVFRVREALFDVNRLRGLLESRLAKSQVQVRRGIGVQRMQRQATDWDVTMGDGTVHRAQRVYVCVYSGLNRLLAASDLPLIPLKQELTEMALVQLPDVLRSVAVTVMCGPFFSVMPCPSRPGLHTFSHVRYTPHAAWSEDRDRLAPISAQVDPRSNFPYMVRDAARLMPLLAQAKYESSWWETKSILPASDIDDSRPILFRRDHGGPGLTCILGGKIDNVYDMFQEMTCAPC